jgi:hypothetical protein
VLKKKHKDECFMEISGQYIKFMSDIIESGTWAKLSSASKTLYPVLLKFSDQNFKNVWPSTNLLLQLTGFKSKKSIIEGKRELASVGLLFFKPGSGRTNSTYHFSFNYKGSRFRPLGDASIHLSSGSLGHSERHSSPPLGDTGINPNHINITINNNHSINQNEENSKKELKKIYGDAIYNEALRNLVKKEKMPDFKHLNDECLNLSRASEDNDSAQHIIDSWKKFLQWSKLHLTKSSTVLFETLKIDVDGSTIYIPEILTEFQKQIITKYFESNITPRIIVLYKQDLNINA